MSTTCIVNPGRAVQHQGRRREEGALLQLDADDVRQLTASGDVSIYVPNAAPVATQLSADEVNQAIDHMAAAVASGELVDAGQPDRAAEPEADQAATPAEPDGPAEAPAETAQPKPAAKSSGRKR